MISDYFSDIVDAVVDKFFDGVDVSDLNGVGNITNEGALDSLSDGLDMSDLREMGNVSDENMLENLSDDEINHLEESYDVSETSDLPAENTSQNYNQLFTSQYHEPTYLHRTEKEWKELAAKEYAEHGDTIHYENLMKDAAKAHADVDHSR